MFRTPLFLLIAFGLLFGSACHQAVAPPPPLKATPVAPTSGYAAVAPEGSSKRIYVFGWGELPSETAKPRGGSTKGTPVTLAPGKSLPLPEIASAPGPFERDRAAILAFAGDYKVSFHFMESAGFASEYQPVRPYHSWATEHVRVIEDTGRFISLQHTLVMFFQNKDGSATEPMLTKHWRQDWTYEDTDLHTFRGDATWARRRANATEASGCWSQAVFQVDDSPRYEALGRWEHRGNVSAWTSERAWRPLPRREHSVRSDYDVMEGIHRIVITPTGWLHEQNNWKRVAGEKAGTDPRYVGTEIGLDRYERIVAPSLVAADDYWRKTGMYWRAVRQAWREAFERYDRFKLLPESGGRKLFEAHFEFADKFVNNASVSPTEAEDHARRTVAEFLRPAETNVR